MYIWIKMKLIQIQVSIFECITNILCIYRYISTGTSNFNHFIFIKILWFFYHLYLDLLERTIYLYDIIYKKNSSLIFKIR